MRAAAAVSRPVAGGLLWAGSRPLPSQRSNSDHRLWFCEPVEELREAVDLIVVFAVGKEGDFALEISEPGRFLRYDDAIIFTLWRDG
jgi:hypothetical protein